MCSARMADSSNKIGATVSPRLVALFWLLDFQSSHDRSLSSCGTPNRMHVTVALRTTFSLSSAVVCSRNAS
jgi:hypothetical protein